MENNQKFYSDFLTDEEYSLVRKFLPYTASFMFSYLHFFFDHPEATKENKVLIAYSKEFLSFIGSTMSIQGEDQLKSILENFQGAISKNDDYVGDFYKFTDGYLFTRQFDLYEFSASLSDFAYDFNNVLGELYMEKKFDYENFRKFTINLSNAIILKNDNPNKEMSSFQFAELCLMKAIRKEFLNCNIAEILQ